MKEDQNNDTDSTPSREDSEVISLIKQIQQQMVYLEKKLDLLLAQSPQKSSREDSFSRPRRSFGDSFRHGKGRHEHRPGGGFSHGRPSFDRPREGGSSEGRRDFSGEGNFDRGNRFDRPRGEGNFKPFRSKGKFFDKKRERKNPHKHF